MHRKRRAKGQSYAFKHALIRDAAYESMLKRARQKVHADIARALIERFSDTAAARPDLLAAHLAEAQREAEAVRYMLKAIDDSLQHSANAEAMGYAQQAFEWLEAVEPGRARQEMELHLQSATIAALIALKGPGTTEVENRISRAQDLLGQVSDSPFMVPILIRLALYYQMRGRYQEASAVGERCLALAERTGDSAAQVGSLTILAQNHWFTGDLHGAQAAAERALSLYDAAKHANYAIVSYAIDFKVTLHGVLCTTVWFLGYPDRALAEALKGIAHSEELGHANSKAMALLYLTGIHRYRRDLQEFGKALGQFHEVTKRHGLYVGAFASVYFGWVTGEVEGPKQIIAGFRAYGHVFSLTYWDSVIAETDATAGRLDAALERIDACIQEAQTIGEIYYLAELLRLKGALLLKQDARAVEAAEASFRRSIEVARAQRNRMFELRSITSLGALVRASGRAEEIRSPLEWLCREITEGAELPDLKEARALLAELPN